LREFTGGRSQVEIEPRHDFTDASALWILYPGVRDRVATEQGQVREHIKIFIEDENVRTRRPCQSRPLPDREISDYQRRQWWLILGL